MAADKLVGQTMSGLVFNEWIKGPFYKVLAENLQHYDFKYKEGLNIDHLKFNPADECKPGGLYFTDEANLVHYLSYGTKIGILQIPADARVYIESSKFKADRLIITKIIKMSELKLLSDPIWCKQALEFNILVCKYIQVPTYEMCLASVQRNGLTLEYIAREHKTKELCRAAVEEDGEALRFIPRDIRTRELCMVAVKQNGFALRFVPLRKRTPEICLAAVEEDGQALQYVHIQTPEICLTAVNQDKSAIEHVKDDIMRARLMVENN